ncbi:MAG TPA: protein kinase [Longimicrobiaceae bacterium]|nr:protein kinase [Longimicrobiaceae bacterium]
MLDEGNVLSDLDQLRSRYDVLRQLGRDGAYPVYAVRSRSPERHFAVHVPERPRTGSAKAGDLHISQAHTMAPLTHPKLMEIHAVHHLQDGAVAVAMVRRRGRTLAERLESEGPLPAREAEAVLRDVAEALAYLHGRSVTHRGVRPQSIFLDRDAGHARLAPFGIDRDGADGSADATPKHAYLAPEQLGEDGAIEERRVSARTDLYALGLTAYAMLTGRQPWKRATVETLPDLRASAPLAPLATLRPDAPPYLREAIEACLERSPRRRPKDVEDMLRRLDPAAPPARPRPAGAATRSLAAAFESVRTTATQRLRTPANRRLAVGLPLAAAVAVVSLMSLSSFGLPIDADSARPGGGSAAARPVPPAMAAPATVARKTRPSPERPAAPTLSAMAGPNGVDAAQPPSSPPSARNASPPPQTASRQAARRGAPAAEPRRQVGYVLLGEPVHP